MFIWSILIPTKKGREREWGRERERKRERQRKMYIIDAHSRCRWDRCQRDKVTFFEWVNVDAQDTRDVRGNESTKGGDKEGGFGRSADRWTSRLPVLWLTNVFVFIFRHWATRAKWLGWHGTMCQTKLNPSPSLRSEWVSRLSSLTGSTPATWSWWDSVPSHCQKLPDQSSKRGTFRWHV